MYHQSIPSIRATFSPPRPDCVPYIQRPDLAWNKGTEPLELPFRSAVQSNSRAVTAPLPPSSHDAKPMLHTENSRKKANIFQEH